MKKILPFIIFITVFAILSFFNVSLFYSFLFALGIGILFQRLANIDNMRDVQIKEITRQRSVDLNNLFAIEIEKVKNLGYTFLDEFAFESEKILSTSLCFIDNTNQIIVSFSQYNFLNNPTLISVSTYFEDSYFLTTSNSRMTGNIPFIEKYMIQIFDGADIIELLEKHRQSLNFLSKYNFKQICVSEYSFRNLILEESRLIFKYLGNNIALKSMFYSLNDKYLDYSKLIAEQDLKFEDD